MSVVTKIIPSRTSRDSRPAAPRSARRRAVRRSAIGATAVAASLVLAACGSSSTSSTAAKTPTSSQSTTKTSSKVTTIVYWNMWSGIYSKLIQSLVNEFNAANPTVHVNMLSVPSADGDAKLLSSIAAGDPPSVFTEWNPEIGSYASTGAIQELNQFETGKYAGVSSWMYPIAADWGSYKGKLYGLPMSMNTYALYYNKTMLKKIGQSSPPSTFAQLMSDQAKEWKTSGGRLTQIGLYPGTSSIGHYACMFDASVYSGGKYDLSTNPGMVNEFKWIKEFTTHSYSEVTGFDNAFGATPGGSTNPFVTGHEGFRLTGPWDGIDDVPADNPSLSFGVEAMPAPISSRTGCTYVNGNYNVIPKGAPHPKAAWKFMTWMSGYNNAAWAAKTLPKGAWMPPSPTIAKQAAYTKWVDSHSYLKTFVAELANKYDYITPVTPNEAEYETASANGLEDLETGKMGVSAALSYIDSNSNSAKS
jgi:multiple sugar transport system substrate-binding protein